MPTTSVMTEPAAIRTILRIIDALPVFYLIGIILVFVTNHKQRLGDLAADTFVHAQESNQRPLTWRTANLLHTRRIFSML